MDNSCTGRQKGKGVCRAERPVLRKLMKIVLLEIEFMDGKKLPAPVNDFLRSTLCCKRPEFKS